MLSVWSLKTLKAMSLGVLNTTVLCRRRNAANKVSEYHRRKKSC